MEKISVIIPVYNVEDYIEQCIKSVTNQTLKDIEIIFVDDCGNDNSIKIVNNYAKLDSRIKIIHHKINKGLGEARNTGIINSHGEYIILLDSDDYFYSNDTLSNLYKEAIRTNSDITISKVNVFCDKNDNNNPVINKRIKDVSRYLNYTQEDSYQVELSNFKTSLSKIPCVVWGKLYKASFINNNKLEFIKANIVHEDDGFNLKVLSAYPNITLSNIISVNYRIRQGSVTSEIEIKKNKKKKTENMHAALCDAINYIEKNHKKDISQQMIKIIKDSKLYSGFFGINCKPYFYFVWSKNKKEISVFRIKLFQQGLNKKRNKVTRILYLPIYTSKVYN